MREQELLEQIKREQEENERLAQLQGNVTNIVEQTHVITVQEKYSIFDDMSLPILLALVVIAIACLAGIALIAFWRYTSMKSNLAKHDMVYKQALERESI